MTLVCQINLRRLREIFTFSLTLFLLCSPAVSSAVSENFSADDPGFLALLPNIRSVENADTEEATAVAAGEQLFEKLVDRYSGQIKFGLFAGGVVSYQQQKNENDELTNRRRTAKFIFSGSSLTYNVTNYLILFGAYGTLAKSVNNVHHAAALGFDYDDLIGVTLFVGVDLSYPDDIQYLDSWFLGIGFTWDDVSIDLTDLLQDENEKTLGLN